MPHGNHRKNLITDKNTDYLLNYFINDEKLNEQLRPELNEENDKNQEMYENYKPKLDGTVDTEKITTNISSNKSSSSNKNTSNSNSNSNSNGENSSSESDSNSNNNSTTSASDSSKTPYKNKIVKTETTKYTNIVPPPSLQSKPVVSDRPLLGSRLVANIEKYAETAEEKRARSRDIYSKLQDLVETYKVKLTRHFSIDDDPDIMEAELKMHKERKHKANQIHFYKGVFINITTGIEFLNERYDPFDFKLKDWSKQIATDIDSYTEVLEELYEKYKDKGAKIPPELKLIFMVVMSAVSYHVTQTMFGSSGISEAIKNNGGMLNNIMNGLMGNSSNTNNAPKTTAPNNRDLLDKINRMTKQNPQNTVPVAEENIKTDVNKKILENQLKYQNDMFKAQMEQLQNERNNILMEKEKIEKLQSVMQPVYTQVQSQVQPVYTQVQPVVQIPVDKIMPVSGEKIMQILPSKIVQPSKNSPIIFSNSSINVFDEDSDIKISPENKVNKEKNNEFMDIAETLDSTSEDFNEIIKQLSNSSKKNNQRISSAKKNGSSRKKKTETRSDYNTPMKKGIIRL